MTITEKNEVIARFMGFIYHAIVDIDYSDCGGIYTKTHVRSKNPIFLDKYEESDQCYISDNCPEKELLMYGDLKYDSSLEWLIKACQKFVTENKNHSEQENNFELLMEMYVQRIIRLLTDFLYEEATILDIHQALYEGIEWLNKQQKKEA